MKNPLHDSWVWGYNWPGADLGGISRTCQMRVSAWLRLGSFPGLGSISPGVTRAAGDRCYSEREGGRPCTRRGVLSPSRRAIAGSRSWDPPGSLGSEVWAQGQELMIPGTVQKTLFKMGGGEKEPSLRTDSEIWKLPCLGDGGVGQAGLLAPQAQILVRTVDFPSPGTGCTSGDR